MFSMLFTEIQSPDETGINDLYELMYFPRESAFVCVAINLEHYLKKKKKETIHPLKIKIPPAI